jgi:hypothetical protein
MRPQLVALLLCACEGLVSSTPTDAPDPTTRQSEDSGSSARDEDAGTVDSGPVVDAGPTTPPQKDAGPVSGQPGDGGVRILFPVSGATDEAQLVARGVGSQLSSVEVNGHAAQSTDGFRTWTATVTLAAGPNDIVVTARDLSGAAVTGPKVVVTGGTRLRGSGYSPRMGYPRGIQVTSDGRFIYTAEPYTKGTYQVEVATGAAKLLQGANHTRLAYPNNVDVALDERDGRVYSPSGDEGLMLYFELGTGDEYEVAAGTWASTYVEHIAYEPQGQRLIVLGANASGAGTLYGFDASTGVRTVLSDATKGAGPALRNVTAVALDAAAGKVYCSAVYANALSVIDLSTGDRAALPAGSGPSPGEWAFLASSTDEPGVLYGQWGAEVYRIAVATGARKLVASATVGRGVPLQDIGGMTYADGVLYLVRSNNPEAGADPSSNMIFALDPSTGDRLIITNF